MKKNLLLGLISGLLLIGMVGSASASLLVEQYDDFWSQDVNALKAYAAANIASSSAEWDVIDFTDDPNGFAGAIPGSNPWPSAAAANASGTSHSLNNTFFARITGDFFVGTADTYTFRTFNDDGVFLFVDDSLTINDPNLHPEREFTGSQYLSSGIHSIELYFFENGGEASLEFTLADSSGIYTHFDNPDLQTPVPEPGTMILFSIGCLSLVGFARRRK